MGTEKVHIHTLNITRTGEKQLFQIKLPMNAKKITGIQITVEPNTLVDDFGYTEVQEFRLKGIGIDKIEAGLIVY